jgi:xanthine dehydrogenase accessory factor
VKDLLGHLDRWRRQGEAIALATVVRVRGSAPRPPGARLAVTRGGEMAGSVSGGCVEGDVIERALLALDSGEAALATYGIADDAGLDVGLTCRGSIDVLIEPFRAGPAWELVRGAVATGRPAALAVALAPAALTGRTLAVLGDGATAGSVDPALDRRVAAEARRRLAEGGTGVAAFPFGDGEASVYLEAFPAPPRLYVVGATHTAAALCRLAKPLGFHVTVIDPRRAYLSAERFPEADALLRAQPGEVLEAAGLGPSSAVVTLAHDPKLEVPALARGLSAGARYVGAMGSRATHERRKAELRRLGFAEIDLDRIRAPIGLDIGGRTPEEIALAILAEILAVRAGREGGALARTRVFLSGVILAAGASARMGRPKQLLPLGGRPLLQHVLDAAAGSRLDEVVLVLGAAADEIRAAVTLPSSRPVRVVVNPAYAEGQSGSLRLGLGSVDPRAAATAVLLGDEPHVTPALIDRMAATFVAAGAPVVRPVWIDRRGHRVPGHPVLFARRVWPEIARLEGDRGARDLLAERPEWRLELPIDGEPPLDVDDPDDYRRAAGAAPAGDEWPAAVGASAIDPARTRAVRG